MGKTKRNILCIAIGVSSLFSVQAETKLSFTENSNIKFSISRAQYNRLLVKNDAIKSLYYPAQNLTVKYLEDGSVYADALDDRPFTLFVETKGGRHFSAKVTINNVDGQTIEFEPKIIRKKIVINKISRKTTLVSLMRATSKQQKIPGFKTDLTKGKTIRLQPKLNLNQVYALESAKLVSQKFALKNIGNKPLEIKREWLTDKQTQSILLSEHTIYPHQEISIVRVEAVNRG